MSSKSFAIEIKAVNIFKFEEATTGDIYGPVNGKTSLNILPQILEIDLFQSIFSPVMRCEIAVHDTIALFTNFPISGEEVLVIKYKNIATDIEYQSIFVIDTISDLSTSDTLKANSYIISGVAIEAYVNALGGIMQAYEGDTPTIARNLLTEHVFDKLKQVFPSYKAPSTYFENNETQSSTIVIPNLPAFRAMNMLVQLMISEVSNKYNFLFFQTSKGFHISSVQGLTGTGSRTGAIFNKAKKLKYRYLSNEVTEATSDLKNEERILSNLVVNRRFGSLSKLSLGYFNNKLFEINIAQKAIWIEPSSIEDVDGIAKNKLNTDKYIETAGKFLLDEDQSNRVKYKITAQQEGDTSFPVSRMRTRWGKDLITKNSMSQIDLTVTMPGTNAFVAGDLFYLEFPENTSFTDPKLDDLVTGYFLITEIKHTMTIGGHHTTVMRINKDSYNTSINRESRYGVR